MTTFGPGRDQDAWFVVRGFAYQVDVTLRRWITLEPSTELMLECGEDIDHLSTAIQQRTLEQVKRMDDALTLRHAVTVVAVVNFLQHRQRNPGLALRYQLTTTARIGTERPTLLPQTPLPGLELWHRARGPHEQALRATLRGFMTELARPGDLKGTSWDGAWQYFRTFWTSATDEEVRALMLDLDWNCGSPESPSLQSEVEALLLERGLAPNAESAQAQYPRLFVHAMRLLSTKGEKRLRAADLAALLAGSSWSSDDQALYRLVRHLDGRISSLESAQATVEQRVSAVNDTVQLLAAQAGFSGTVVYGARSPLTFTPPPVPVIHSRREDTVVALRTALGAATWLGLHGVIGLGKSDLSLLLARSLGKSVHWVDLQGVDERQCCARLDKVSAQLRGLDEEFSAATFKDSCVLVLDDLPTPKSPELLKRLRALHQGLEARDITMISTGHQPLPVTTLRSASILSLPAPAFTEREVQDVLLAYGMPPERRYATFIRNLTSGHASLVVAAAQFLSEADWDLSDGVLSDLLTQGYGEHVQHGTFERLLETVTEASTRELLYRLTLARSPFELAQVRAVADVEPLIATPREHLTRLTGLWIQPRGAQRYSVAPVVSHAGADLSETLVAAVKLALAEELLTHEVLDQDDAEWAVLYLLGAGQVDRAGLIWIVAVSELRKHELPFVPTLFRMWIGMPLPRELQTGYAYTIRILQLAVGTTSAAEKAYILEDLRRIVPLIPASENWPLILAFMDRSLAEADFPLACQVAQQLFSADLKLGYGAVDASLAPGVGTALQHLSIILSVSVNGVEDLLLWIDLADEAVQRRAYPFGDDVSWQTLEWIGDWRFMHEFRKPASDQNWGQVFIELELIAARAKRSLLPTLWSRVVEAQVIVLGEHLRDLPAALEQARQALEESATNEERLILNEVAGRQCFLKQRYADAVPWLEAATTLSVTRGEETWVKARMLLSACVGRVDAQAAAELAQATASAAGEFTSLDFPLRARVYGEAALACWGVDDHLGTYRWCVSAFAELHRQETESSSWREPYLKLLFLITQCVQDLDQDQATLKNSIQAGGPGFVRHSFGAVHPEVASDYSDFKRALEETVLGQFAALLGLDDDVETWGWRGLDNPHVTLIGVGSLCRGLVAGAVRRADDTQTVALARRSAVAMIAAQTQQLQVRECDLPDLLARLTSEQRAQIENFTRTIAVLPVAFATASALLHHSGRGRERANAFAQLCLAQGAQSEPPEGWGDVAEALMSMGLSLVSAATKYRRANQAMARNDLVAGVLWQLALTLDPTVPLEVVLKAQLSQLDALIALWGRKKNGSERFVIDTVVAVWRDVTQPDPYPLESRQIQTLIELRSGLVRLIEGVR